LVKANRRQRARAIIDTVGGNFAGRGTSQQCRIRKSRLQTRGQSAVGKMFDSPENQQQIRLTTGQFSQRASKCIGGADEALFDVHDEISLTIFIKIAQSRGEHWCGRLKSGTCC